MILTVLLCLLLLILVGLMIREENNTTLIILFFLFSFVSASIYLISSAPDIALAEIAIGCAFIPLVYIITIMRQNTFTVAFYDGDETQSYCDPEVLIRFMALLEEFCDLYELKPRLITHPIRYKPAMEGIFRPGNIDILADYDETTGILNLTGNGRNLMIPQLEKILGRDERIRFTEAGLRAYED